MLKIQRERERGREGGRARERGREGGREREGEREGGREREGERFLICQSKGNSQIFMCYRLAATCIYLNSSFVEFSMVI